MLETDHLLFRGEFRLKIPFADMTSVDAANSTLKLGPANGVAAFELGPEAAKLAQKTRNPPTRLGKLGVMAGLRVALQRLDDEAFVDELRAAGVEFGEDDLNLLFMGARSVADLDDIRHTSLKRSGAIWIMYPKGRKELRESDVLAGGQAAGLVDTKVASFSSTHTALKFVIPVAKRRGWFTEVRSTGSAR